VRPMTVLFGLALALFISVGAPRPARAAPDFNIEAGDITLGSPKAKVTVIEYASASCPHCAKFNNDVLPAFKAKYIDTGKVRYALREFLTPPEDVAAAGFLAARCGGAAHYYTILDQIFRHQTEIYQTGDLHGVLVRAAKVGGVSEAQLDTCIYDGAALADLNERVNRYVVRDGIQFTPSLVVNGKLLRLPGEPTLADLEKAVDDAEKAS